MPSKLKFAVLGPVRVWRGDAELDLGAPQQRALLAMLLLAEGRQVMLDELVSGLWEDDLPPAAIGTVRTYVSRLRRGLKAPDQKSIIKTADAGYVISSRPGEFDMETFERLTREAREAPAGGDGERQAAALLREALSLGQGVPLAGIPGPFAEAQRTRISELLMAATEECLALDIELGAHAAAIAELQTLRARHPMRERLSELLMLALYRSGRQADALAVFDSARRRLAEDLGIDPGPAMQKMHQRILQNDESLASPAQPPRHLNAAADARPSAPVETPAQLPADLASFTGRHRELALLDSLLDDVSPSAGLAIAAIDGMAGIGKTALAVHWARQLADRFPDGQLYANLRGFDPAGRRTPPGEVLRSFLAALGAAPRRVPDDLDAQASMYRSLLNGRRVLVLLDNVRDMEQVRPLLPGSPGCLVLVTSRNRMPALLTAHGARTVTLDAFSTEEARHALGLRLGTERTATAPQALDEIIDRCAGLPLALAIVAARATLYPDLPLEEIAAELRSARTRLDALSIDGAAADVRAAFSWSYRLLSESAQRMFRLLSVHDGLDFSKHAAANLAGLPEAEAQPLLAELAAASLLTESRPGRFTTYDLIQVYAAELSAAHDTPTERRAAAERLFGHRLHSSHAAQSLLRTHSPVPEPAPSRHGRRGEATRLIHDAIAIYREAGDLNGESDCWVRLGQSHHLLGEDEQATTCYRHAIDLLRELGSRTDEAWALISLGESALGVGDYSQAREAWETAVAILSELGLPSVDSVRQKLRRLQTSSAA